MLLDDLVAHGFATLPQAWHDRAVADKDWSGPPEDSIRDLPKTRLPQVPILFEFGNVIRRLKSSSQHSIENAALDLSPLGEEPILFECLGTETSGLPMHREGPERIAALVEWNGGQLTYDLFQQNRLGVFKEAGPISLPWEELRGVGYRWAGVPPLFIGTVVAINMLNDPSRYTWEEHHQLGRAERRRAERENRPVPFRYRKIIMVPAAAAKYRKLGTFEEGDGLPTVLPFHEVRPYTRRHPKDHDVRVTVRGHFKGDPNLGIVDHLYKFKKPRTGPGIGRRG